MDLKTVLKQKRPNLSASSITTYASTLNNLFSRVFGDKPLSMDGFNDTEAILKHLKEVSPNKRKSILSSLVVLTGNTKYRDVMLGDIEAFNKQTSKQEKSEKTQTNWVSQKEIKDIYEKLKSQATELYKKTTLSPSDLQKIQDYIIIALLGGVFIPPRRSKDYVDFKVRNLDKSLNYLEGNDLVFNSYKTAKYYSTQKVEIPMELLSIIQNWVRVTKSEWLLFDLNGEKLTNVKLTQRLNKIFGKKASINILRHSYLTDKYGDTIEKEKALQNDMAKMGSSTSQREIYIQK